jgi:cell division protease FtsH
MVFKLTTSQIIGIVGICLILLSLFISWYKKRKQQENPQKESTEEQPLPKSKRNNRVYYIALIALVVIGYLVWNNYKDKPVELPLSEVITLSKTDTFSEMELKYSGSYGTLHLVVSEGLDLTAKNMDDKEITITGGDKLVSDVGYIGVSTLKEMGLVLPEKFSADSASSGIDWGQWLYLLVMIGIIYWVFKGLLFSGKTEKFVKDKTSIRFSDVGGMVEAKDSLKEVVAFLVDKEHFNQLGARIPKGILLEGLPGNGKTMLARAVATEAGVDFYYTTGSDFHSMWVGVAASKIKKLFKQAKKSPSIIFIDEFDSIAHNRGSSGSDVGREWNHTLNQLLSEMDGFTPNTQVIVIAATNRADVLDPAILRAGRFDRKIVVPLPDLKDREEILKIHMKGKPVADDINIEAIAKSTSGYSGADLALLLNEAAILAGREKQSVITYDNINKAMDKVMAGDVRKNFKLTEDDKKLIAYHEAGHALVAQTIPEADKVQRISILPRGHAGGFTKTAPETEQIVLPESKALAMISVLLAGRASEEIALKQTTSGAQSDLQKANEIAKEMVEHLGMGETFGMRYVGSSTYGIKDVSVEGQKQIESDIKNILDKCYQKAIDTITENRDKLDALVLKLLEKESVNIEDIVNILK